MDRSIPTVLGLVGDRVSARLCPQILGFVMSIAIATLGTPRIGPRRELKFALEAFWAGQIGRSELLEIAAALRAANWADQAARGITVIPSGDFSL